MKSAKNDTKNKSTISKVANSVSFSSDRLSDKKTVSKDRERYIKSVSAKALTAISA